MKGDDDTFVKVDAVLDLASSIPYDRSFYIGNINYYHKPLRYGKWAVTYEVFRMYFAILFHGFRGGSFLKMISWTWLLRYATKKLVCRNL